MKLSDILFEGDMSSVVLYHGTLRSNLEDILSNGLSVHEGWGGAGTSGVYLTKSIDGALYWAKLAYMREIEEDLEAHKFDRKYGKKINDLLVVLKVTIPADKVDNLRADMEQAEDYGFEGDPEDWRGSLDVIGDVMYSGVVPSEWIQVVS